MTGEADSGADGIRWGRVRAALERAFDAGSEQGEALLEEELADAPELLAAAREMLADDAREDDYMQPPAVRMPDVPLERIGPYVLRQRLGAGGMGSVYLAERADGAFRREAALKLLHFGLESDELLARFQRERQVQANLSHPCIAGLLDGGTTESGRPYLVVEYVEGTRIDRSCDERRLAISERLELFAKVCSAVQHAHERHVVHRDIKPSNILVTAEGEPKLLDFGIAKVLNAGELTEAAALTHEGARLMTPAYASPEQMRGEVVTPASDLYSLGALLYELLTGRTPHDLAGSSPAQAERLVCEEEPVRPSMAIARASEATRIAERRHTTVRALRRSVSGDLDRIVLMCLRKEPRRRYASVAALAEDIGRYRAGRPILARPDSALYRAERFVRRHALLVAAASVLFVVLATSLVIALSLFEDSRDANALAGERLANLRSFRKDVIEELRRTFAVLPGAASEAGSLMRVTLDHLDRERASAMDDPALLLELAEAYTALAAVTGVDAGGGGLAAARESYQKAREVAERAHALNPDDARTARMHWLSVATLGFQIGTEDIETARALQREALVLIDARDPGGDWPDGSNLLNERGLVYSRMLAVELDHGSAERAREFGALALESIDAFTRARPDMEVFIRGDRAFVTSMLATAELQRGQPQRSLELLNAAREAFEFVARGHGANSNVLRILPGVELRRGRALAALERHEEAETAMRSSLAALREIAADNPGNVLVVLDVASAARVMGGYLLDRDRADEAAPILQSAFDSLRELADLQPGQKVLEVPLDHLELLLGRAGMEQDPAGATRRIETAARRLAERASGSNDDYATLTYLAEAHRYLGELKLAHDPYAASASIERARAIVRILTAEGRGGPSLETLGRELDALLDRADPTGR